MGKRLISMLLAMLMVFGMLPTQALAEELNNSTGEVEVIEEGGETASVAEINGEGYASLAEAIAAANEGDTILVTAAEIELPTITKAGLTFKTTVGTKVTNKINNTNSDYGWRLEGTTFEGFEFTKQAAFVGKDLTFKKCSFTGGNGLYYGVASGTWLIENCVFDCSTYNLQFGSDATGTVNVNNCVFNGGFNTFGDSVEMNFNGCTFNKSTKGNYNVLQTYGNMTIRDCTVAADWPTGTQGGTFGSVSATAVTEIYNTTYNGTGSILDLSENKEVGIMVIDPTKDADGKYTGGTFAAKPADDKLAEGVEIVENEDGTFGVESAPTITGTNVAAYTWNKKNGFEGKWLIFGQAGPITDPKESFVLKVYGEDKVLLATTKLTDAEYALSADTPELSWHITIGEETNDKNWETTWEANPRADVQPKYVEMWIDGALCDTTSIHMGHPDFAADVVTWANIPGVHNVISGETTYDTLQAAIDAAASGAEIKLLSDIANAEPVTVASDDVIILDLAGYTVSSTDTNTVTSPSGNYQLILNNGNLTIKDSVGGGKMTVVATTNRGYNALSAVISNKASLTVEDGTLQHLGGNSLAMAVDNNSSAGNATLTVNGGTLSSTYAAVRQFANGATNSVIVNNGTLEAGVGVIYMQLVSENTTTKLDVVGGTISAVNEEKYAVYCGINGGDPEKAYIDISGGSFEGKITMPSKVPNIAISGGNFTVAPNEEYLAEGFELVGDETNGYGVQEVKSNWTGTGTEEDPYVITTVAGLVELQDRVNDSETFADNFFKLGNDIDLTDIAWKGIGIYNESAVGTAAFQGTFDGDGHKISGVTFGESDSGLKYRGFFNQIAYATVKNVTIETNGFGYTADQIGTMPGSMGGAVIAGHAIASTIEGCVAEGTLVGTHNVAGIVVLIQGSTIKNCTNKANLTNSYSKLGGIVNFSQHKGVDANYKGSLIEGCVNEGTVTSTARGENGVGGIIGWIGYGDGAAANDAVYAVTIKNCENKGTITATSTTAKVGQMVGSGESYIVDGGSNKGLTTTFGIGDNNGYFAYATVANGVATYVSELEAGNEYLVTALNAKPVIKLAPGESITFNTALATIDETGITAETEITSETDDKVITYTAAPAVAQIGDTVYGTLQAAINAANNGDKIVILADFAEKGTNSTADPGEFFVRILDKEITIDLGGYTFTGSLYLNSGAKLTIDNGKIRTLAGNESSCIESVGGSLVLGEKLDAHSSARHAIRVKGGTAVINGGTYQTTATGNITAHALNISHASNVTVNNGVFKGSKGFSTATSGNAVMIQDSASIVNIYGGDFSNAIGVEGPVSVAGGLTIHNGSFDDWPSSYDKYVTETKAVTYNAETERYILVDATVKNETTGKRYGTLQDAVNEAGKGNEIVLLADITEEGTLIPGASAGEDAVQIPTGKEIVLNLGGFTYNGSLYGNDITLTVKNGTIKSWTKASGIEVENTTLTLEKDLTVIAANRHAIRIKGGNTTVNGGNYTTNGIGTMYALRASNNATVVINDGTFTGPGAGGSDGSAVVLQGGTMTINGGTYTNGSYSAVAAYGGMINIKGGIFHEGVNEDSRQCIITRGGGDFTIEGGTFHGETIMLVTGAGYKCITGGFFSADPSAYCTPGYVAVKKGDMYEVIEFTNWFDVADTTWYDAEKPQTSYTIDSEEELAGLAVLVNSGTSFKDVELTLTKDLDLSGATYGVTGIGWPGIGLHSRNNAGTTSFQGIFDGNGKKIINMLFSDETENGTKDPNNYRGLFNQIANATVKNVTVSGVGFGENVPSGEYGGAMVVGHAINSTIENCVANGSITGNHNTAGVVVRLNGTIVKNCTNNADVTGSYNKLGGIAAMSQSTEGAQVSCTIENCVNNGKVTSTYNGELGHGHGVGGIIGWGGYYGIVTIKDCTNTGVVSGTSSTRICQIAGEIGTGSKVEGTNKGLANMLAVNNAVEGLNYATVDENGVATYVAKLEAGNEYLVTSNGLKPVVKLASGEFITFDTTLAAIDETGITAVPNLGVTKTENGNKITFTAATAVAQIGEKLYGNLQEAINAVQNGETIVLLADINLTEDCKNYFEVNNGKDFTVDLNGKTIIASGCNGVFKVSGETKLTIEATNGGTVTALRCKCDYAMAIWITAGGEVVINGGTFNQAGDGYDAGDYTQNSYNTVYISNGGTVTINDGYFECKTSALTLNIKDADRDSCSIVVNGGSFYKFNPSNNVAEGDYTNFAAEGLAGKADANGVYTVVPATAQYKTAAFATLAEALAAVKTNEGETVTLLANAEEDVTVKKNITLALGEFDVTSVTVNGVLVITGSGKKDMVLTLAEGNTDPDVTKAAEVEITAPDGYEWNAEGKLVEKKEPVKFAGTTMVLKNSLAMNFYISKDNFEAQDIENDVYYAKLIKKYADGRPDAVVEVKSSEWFTDVKDIYYGVSFENIAAKEMTDEVSVQIFLAADDTPVTDVFNDSVRKYAMRTLNNPATTSELLKTTVVDMLNYGAAAQEHFGYNVSDLANSQLTDAQKAYATTEDIEMDNIRENGANFAGTSLFLESNIRLTLYFSGITNTNGMTAKITFTDHYGNAKEFIIEGKDFIKNGSFYGVKIDKLVVADISVPVTCTVYNADGSEYGSAKDSIESYLARGGEGEIYTAIMKFATAAYSYFHIEDSEK